MAIEAEMRRKILVSVLAVGLFIAVIVGVGATYSGSGLTATGGLLLVGLIAAFVVVMGVVGLFLDR